MDAGAASKTEAVSPLHWPWALQSPPVTSSETCGWRTGLLRRWAGTSPVMVQPPLDHHYVVMHLGGPKLVSRRHDGPSIASVVEEKALTLVPAGSAYVWDTRGPISFAHLYLKPEQIASFVERNFESDGRKASLIDKVGCSDAFLQPLLTAMVDEAHEGSDASKLRLDSLFESVCFQLVHGHTSRPASGGPKVVALAAHRLRRVLEFIEARLGDDLSLADLAASAGTGQAHFSRAFQIATGCSPYRYLIRRRIEYGKVLLLSTRQPLAEISSACGFTRTAQFAKMFKSHTGIGPKRYRIAQRRG